MLTLLRLFVLSFLLALPARAQILTPEEMLAYVPPPFGLGEALNDKGLYRVVNSGGTPAGYAFTTQPYAALPGFAGAPVNALVVLDGAGTFVTVRVLHHNEPIFISGMGEGPFRAFFEQYAGKSIWAPMSIGTPYGGADQGSSLVHLDGITKATASVRIAHESIMAAAHAVAREHMQGRVTAPAARPDFDHEEALNWNDLVAQGLASHLRVTNAEIDAAFSGTRWAYSDPAAQADPEGLYLDLWLLDVTPPALARAALDQGTIEQMTRFRGVAPTDEFLLLIDAGRHGLVSESFVRNTAPDQIRAEQGGLPVALRDADFLVDLAPGVPDGTAMILRTDRRLGFNPAEPFTLIVDSVREHGFITPEIGRVELELAHQTDERFFLHEKIITPLPPWAETLYSRQPDLIVLALGLGALIWALGARMNHFAGWRHFTPARLLILAVMIGFVGFWGQGQLSIVTPLGALRTALEGGSYMFLIYDPFSLMVWVAAILGFVLWGRGLFCGWLCPFGALQEFAHHLGRALRLPRIEPNGSWDRRLKKLKYIALAGLVGLVGFAPEQIDSAAEVEPFKTAITVFFMREWYFVAYAAFWLVLGMVLFKGFCRYLCPLGAVMAIGGLLRGRDWIARRPECGSPCQLCRIKCNYGAIAKNGRIDYSECFQCLDCVAIHDNEKRCVPLVLAARKAGRAAPTSASQPQEAPVCAASPAAVS
ncbi:4Fe-4S binding protein [Roseinatronobacter alkalisoli]|uniref:4Fe-4S binding protein n=1 Tax=Roseinatronobacter alkalisoli TaxID=3028235 RepID=A0ABT5TAM4_9RHOB|nr:4Fe-4S binding protein [Roseinatronobacter sp. HJB301]MDD7970983.1 4Fe-4S binding protein [Roseinatronobacter sp. HJB301]